MALDLPRLLAALHDRLVDYIVIGGIAAVFHGSPFPTEGLDIAPATGEDNLERLAGALGDLNARGRFERVGEGDLFRCDAKSFAATQIWSLVTDAGDMNVTLRPSGTAGYPDLLRAAVVADLYGCPVRIASLSDVIRSKQAANRPRDLRALPALRELLAERSSPDARC